MGSDQSIVETNEMMESSNVENRNLIECIKRLLWKYTTLKRSSRLPGLRLGKRALALPSLRLGKRNLEGMDNDNFIENIFGNEY